VTRLDLLANLGSHLEFRGQYTYLTRSAYPFRDRASWEISILSPEFPDDLLTDVGALGKHVRNRRAYLKFGVEAMDEAAAVAEIEARMRTGRPLASPEWIAEAEGAMERKLAPQKRGPKPKVRRTGNAN
jgi:hypothetical protein